VILFVLLCVTNQGLRPWGHRSPWFRATIASSCNNSTRHIHVYNSLWQTNIFWRIWWYRNKFKPCSDHS